VASTRLNGMYNQDRCTRRFSGQKYLEMSNFSYIFHI